MKRRVIIGSRGSKLALAQARIVSTLLRSIGVKDIEIRTIRTMGDRDQTSPIIDSGGKGIFIKEIEKELLAGKIDIAVHSLKDMPAKIEDGLMIGAFLPAEDRRDALVSLGKMIFDDLPQGARVGTGSPRRTAQVKLLRPDIEIVPIRGNVDTRVFKVEEGEYDAVILSAAGMKRIGLTEQIAYFFSPEEMIPAPGQGVMAIEIRSDDNELGELLSKIEDIEQRVISSIEFGILRELKATCTTPIGMDSRLSGDRIIINFFLSDKPCIHHIKRAFRTNVTDQEGTVRRLVEEIRNEWKKVANVPLLCKEG